MTLGVLTEVASAIKGIEEFHSDKMAQGERTLAAGRVGRCCSLVFQRPFSELSSEWLCFSHLPGRSPAAAEPTPPRLSWCGRVGRGGGLESGFERRRLSHSRPRLKESRSENLLKVQSSKLVCSITGV